MPIPLMSYKVQGLLVALKRMMGYCSEDIVKEDFDDEMNTARGFPSIKNTEKWEPLVKLLSRKWFTRCWIKQESALPSVALMQIGPHLFPWVDLCHAIRFLLYKGYSSKIPGLVNVFTLCTWSLTSMLWQERSWTPRSLITLLDSTKRLEATVRVDKVYSLLGLAKEEWQIKVDYTRSVKDVYTQVMRVLLQPPSTIYPYPLQVFARLNRYAIRTVQGQKNEREFGGLVPSWVVCWDRLREDGAAVDGWGTGLELLGISSGSVSKFCTGGTEYAGPVDDNPETPYNPEISLGGFVFAKISSNKNICCLPPLERPRLWDFVLDISSLRKSKHTPYPTGESMDEAFAQTLTMSWSNAAFSTGGDTYHAIDFQHSCVALYEKTISLFTEKGRTADIEYLNKEWKQEYLRLKSLVGAHTKSPTFSEDLQSNCIGRTLFATENGYLGLGDNALEPGDLVCVLLGGRTPYVLRPAGGNKYKFLGECYLHGIMYGEALSEGYNAEKLTLM